jgi:hypothetical protein
MAVDTAIQTLRLACLRPGTAVVGNAFQSWGSHLELLAASSPASNREGVDPRAVLAASFKTAGAALMGAGALSANPVVAGAGVVLTFAGEVAKILPGMTPGKITGGAQPLRKPLLVNPPEGCAPGVALALDAARKKAEEPTAWDIFLKWLKKYGPFVGLGTVGLISMYAAFKIMKSNQRRRLRRRNGRRRNAGDLFRVYDKHDPRFLMLTFESEPEAIAYAKGTASRQPHREMQIEVREGKQWRSLATWSRNRNRGR